MNEINEIGIRIGYWEDYYYNNGILMAKGNYSEYGERVGYWEWYNYNGTLWYKGYYIS